MPFLRVYFIRLLKIGRQKKNGRYPVFRGCRFSKCLFRRNKFQRSPILTNPPQSLYILCRCKTVYKSCKKNDKKALFYVIQIPWLLWGGPGQSRGVQVHDGFLADLGRQDGLYCHLWGKFFYSVKYINAYIIYRWKKTASFES